MKIKTMSICIKCSDMFAATFLDKEGEEIGEYDGYVPDFMPGDHGGDYVIMDINLETGKILNWNKPTEAQIEKLMKENEEED